MDRSHKTDPDGRESSLPPESSDNAVPEAEAGSRTGKLPERELKKIERSIDKYFRDMDLQDALEDEAGVEYWVEDKDLPEKIERMKRMLEERRKLEALEKESRDSRTSAADEDAGPAGKRKRGT